MFRSKIVFILGAGSSKEVGMPTGDELKNIIHEKLNFRFDWSKQESGDRKIPEQLRQYVASIGQRDTNSYYEAARTIKKALPLSISIDNVIEAYNHDSNAELMGKVSIVSSILGAEQNSKLYFNRRGEAETINFRETNLSWFNLFFKMLHENVNKNAVQSIFDNVSFINFNYDRCLEQYIYYALKEYYSLADQEAEELVKKLKVIRPYGSVGEWSSTNTRKEGVVAFAEENVDLFAISKKIKTFSEQLEESDELKELRSLISSAEIVVFLGFAFHRQNMNLMRLEKQNNITKRVYATAYGISSPDCVVLKAELQQFFNAKVDSESIELRNDLTCHGLMSAYWRSLTTNIESSAERTREPKKRKKD